MSNSVYIAFILLILFSCNNDDDVISPSNTYDYFPLDKGLFRDFKVEAKSYFLRPDSVLGKLVLDSQEGKFYLRELTTGKFLDIEGDSSTRIEMYTKNQPGQNWPTQADSTAIVKIKNDELIYSLNNLSFVKLIFPIKKGSNWNGNKYNNLGKETYSITSTGKIQIDSLNFEEGILVEQSNTDNFVEIDYRTEEYIPEIGLTRKNKRILQFRQENGEVLTGQIESGTILNMELINYGQIN